MVEVKASGPPHVLKLWLGVSKGMLPVKCFCSTKSLFVSAEFNGDHKTVTKVNLVTLSFWDITTFNAVASMFADSAVCV